MKYKAKNIMRLFEELSKSCDVSLDHGNFGSISGLINESGGSEDAIFITKDYLYKNAYLPARNACKKDGNTEIALNQAYVNRISEYLGYGHFEQFKHANSQPLGKVLEGLVGSWYSYVRGNMSKGVLYASPVKMYIDKRKVWALLKGPSREFLGEVRIQSGCIFCLFASKEGKEFHHVYKIGNMVGPNVLQGIFSGVLSTNEPIGGRALLVRQESDFESLTNEKLIINDLFEHQEEEYRRYAQFFEKYEQNNLRIGAVRTFEIDDIGDGV